MSHTNRWASRSLFIALVLLEAAPPMAHAQDLTAWQKDREAKFAAFKAAHPNPDAEIADIKAKTAALIGAYVPPPTPPKYADLKARSAALTPEQKAQAQAIFATAFKLWQSGDYASAKVGFSQGLAIDPANGLANYYMGDILQRQNDAAGAGLYMDRAATLAPGTAEAFKAGAALQSLPAPDADPALDRAPLIWVATDAPVALWDDPAAPQMVVVPAGEFTMGSPVTEPNRDAAEGPRHRVRIAYALAVSQYPITYGEFARFIAETHYDAGDSCYTVDGSGNWDSRSGRNWRNPGFTQTANSPAACIDYNVAAAYAAWLSKKTGQTYRLLSEAEYEYADRAGTTTAYWWGADADAGCAYANGADLDAKARFPNWDVVNCHDSYVFTSPVGSYMPNAFGLYDTTGNVWSWVSECWNQTYAGAPTDGSVNAGGNCGRRVLRGGSWGNGPRGLRAANRDSNDTGDRNDNNGFRLARTL